MRKRCNNLARSGLVIWLIISAIIASAGSVNKASSVKPPTSASGTRLLKLTLTAKPNPVNVSGSVQMKLSVENKTGKKISYQTSSGQRFEITAERDGKVVWNWSRGKMFTMAIQSHSFDAGQIQAFSLDWNLSDNNGKKVAPGHYKLAAQLKTMGEKFPAPAPVDLVVK